MVISFTSRSEAGLIKAQSLTLSTNEPQHFISGLGFVFSAPYANRTIEFSFPTTAGGKISEITFTNEDTENYIDAYRDRFDFKNAPITVSSIGTSLSTLCQLPNKSGTVALTDDCFSSVSVYSTFRNDASTEKFPLSISKNGRLQFYILKGARPGSSTLSVDVNLALYNGGSLVETIGLTSFSCSATYSTCILQGDITVLWHETYQSATSKLRQLSVFGSYIPNDTSSPNSPKGIFRSEPEGPQLSTVNSFTLSINITGDAYAKGYHLITIYEPLVGGNCSYIN